MKAAVLYANEDIRYEEIPTPELKADQVLVKVKAVGICGSDVPRVLQNGAHYYPIVLGHEFSGEIVALGEALPPT
jgi:L-iditol 2-dehydrogenase